MSGKGKTSPSKKVQVANKQRELPKANSKDIESPETPKECALSFPLLKTVDNARTLPRYSAVLSRPDDEGVGMEDLDGLQLELETLLSAVVVRTRVLQEEIRILSDEEEKRDKTKQFQQKVGRPSLKRAKNQDKATKKFKEAQKSDVKGPAVGSPIKFTKVKTVSLVSNPLTQAPSIPEVDCFETQTEGRKVVAPKNDTPNKFWASIEPYFVDVTKEDIALLHELIAEQETPECKIPALGRHYTARWTEEDGGGGGKTSGPLTQRLVSALLEDNTAVAGGADKRPDRGGAENAGPGAAEASPLLSPTVLRSFSMNFERRLRKELEDQGLVDSPAAADTNGTKEEDDEILSDIRRCSSQLQAVSNLNLVQLRRVLRAAEQELQRQELARKLEEVDAEICDLYRRIQANKLKRKPPVKRDQELAWKALKDREALVKEIDSI